MNIFGRIFKMGQAEAHSLADKLEDPIKLTEQGIRDLKKDLDESLKAYAEVKAMAIRSRNEAKDNKNKAANYEQKAMLIIQKAQNGGMDAAEADRIAGEALVKKEECVQQAATAETNLQNFEKNIAGLDQNIKKLKSNVSKYENELKTLKARAKVSAATTKLNKQMSQIDSGGTVAMLERMKEKVSQEEALAEAYGDISDTNKSIDDEIDTVLSDSNSVKASSALEALKSKMNTPSN